MPACLDTATKPGTYVHTSMYSRGLVGKMINKGRPAACCYKIQLHPWRRPAIFRPAIIQLRPYIIYLTEEYMHMLPANNSGAPANSKQTPRDDENMNNLATWGQFGTAPHQELQLRSKFFVPNRSSWVLSFPFCVILFSFLCNF